MWLNSIFFHLITYSQIFYSTNNVYFVFLNAFWGSFPRNIVSWKSRFSRVFTPKSFIILTTGRVKITPKRKKLNSDLLVQIRRILRQKLRRVFRRNEVGNEFWKKENLAAEDFLDLTDNEFSFAEELHCEGHLRWDLMRRSHDQDKIFFSYRFKY